MEFCAQYSSPYWGRVCLRFPPLFHQISTCRCVSCYPVSGRYCFLLVVPFFWIFPSFHFSPQWHLSLGRRCGDIYVSLRLSVSESHSLPLGQLWVSVLVAIFCKYKCLYSYSYNNKSLEASLMSCLFIRIIVAVSSLGSLNYSGDIFISIMV